MTKDAVGHLTINLNALRENYDILKNKAHGKEIAAAVKANAYGLGAIEITKALLKKGCKTFFVANPDEAIELRNSIKEDYTLYSFSGFNTHTLNTYIHHQISPILTDISQFALYKQNERLPSCALHFDTGMNRLGLTKEEFHEIKNNPELTYNIDIALILSHFSSADEPEKTESHKQYQRFKEITEHFPHIKNSLCNSSGIFLHNDYHFDLLRPGIALYGGNPVPLQQNPMSPVIELTAPIAKILTAKKGSTAGYNQTYKFEKDTELAIINIGYADGLPRTLSNNTSFYYKDYPCPVRGRISMDLTIIDISAIPKKNAPIIGDHIEIIGKNNSLDTLAKNAGTISYEILTSLGQRYKRTYID